MVEGSAQPATLAVVNARAWTGNPAQPWAEAIAVQGDTILAVGSNAEIRKLTSTSARIVDAHGQMLVPGFIDSHVHFIEGGLDLAFALESGPEPGIVAEIGSQQLEGDDAIERELRGLIDGAHAPFSEYPVDPIPGNDRALL